MNADWTTHRDSCYAYTVPSPATVSVMGPASPPSRSAPLSRWSARAQLALAVILTVSCLPAGAQGQEVVVPSPPAIPAGEDRIESLAEGGRAPFRGQLLDTDTAIRWTNALQWWPSEFRLRLESHARELSLIEESYTNRLRIVEESYGREITGLRTDLRAQATTFAEALQREFYETFEFGLVIGLVVSAVLVGLAGWAFSAI